MAASHSVANPVDREDIGPGVIVLSEGEVDQVRNAAIALSAHVLNHLCFKTTIHKYIRRVGCLLQFTPGKVVFSCFLIVLVRAKNGLIPVSTLMD